jgi:hypothetical protein
MKGNSKWPKEQEPKQLGITGAAEPYTEPHPGGYNKELVSPF